MLIFQLLRRWPRQTRHIARALCALSVILMLDPGLLAIAPARAAGQAPPPQATADPMQLRREILADPELQHPTELPELPALPELPRVDLSFLPYAVMAVAALALIVLIVLLGPILFRYFVTARRRRPGVLQGDRAGEVTTSVEAVQRAQSASETRDYRLALRMLYLASLLKLDEIGALRYDRALTNREYVRQVSLKPALAAALGPVVETFDDVWYGFRPITPAGYRAYESRVSELMAAAEQTAKGDSAHG